MPITRRKLDGTAARSLVERSRGAALSYSPVGISLGTAPVPDGFRDVSTERVVGQGMAAYRKVGYALMHWELHRAAGLQVKAQHAAVREGERVGIVIPTMGVMGVSGVCRVVAVVAEGYRTGFAYGSLPKHPVQGEESFLLRMEPDESVVLAVRAVSKPASLYVKLAGPIAHAKQAGATRKLIDAAQRIAQEPAPSHA